MAIETVAVIGAGVIGGGVAQLLAQCGHGVVVVEVDEGRIASAKQALRQGIRTYNLLRAERLSTDEILGRLRWETDLAAAADADFVIENVTEAPDLKAEIYRKLDRICRPDCGFAANTSVIPIRTLAGHTGRRDRFVGMHFMNPVPLKPVVEVVVTPDLSGDGRGLVETLLQQVGLRGIFVSDHPGFVSNRVLMLTINEAACVVADGVASVSDVDQIFVQCFEHGMGPLATADLIGIDTVLRSIELLHEYFGGERFAPAPLLERMVAEGRLGRKSGQGFFNYSIASQRSPV